MQLLEYTPFGLRSAAHWFARDRDDPQVLIVPMVHIATPAFYRQVNALLAPCQIVLAERYGQSSDRLGSLYRFAANGNRINYRPNILCRRGWRPKAPRYAPW